MDWMKRLSRIEPRLQEALIRQSLAPGGWIHASHWSSVVPAELLPLLVADSDQPLRRAALRQLNAMALESFSLDPLDDLSDPWLPVALLEPAAWERWILHCGLLALAPQIRRVIARQEVQTLQDQLGEPALQFARRQALGWAPGDAGHAPLVADQAALQARILGAALVVTATAAAQGPCVQRVRLRLPADAGAAGAQLPESLTSAKVAWPTALSVLEEIDPSWHCLFPVRH